MSIPKQFLNLLGAVVIVAILALGVTLIAIPLYSNSQTVDASTREVTQTNDIYAMQVAKLSAANDRIDEIDAEMATLRAQITPILKIDDVIELAVAAAAANDASIENVTIGELELWQPQAAAAAELAATLATSGDPTKPADDEQNATDETAEDGTADAGATDGATEDSAAAADPAAGEGPAPGEDSAMTQIPVTIEVKVDSAAKAAAFIDALGQGPRLIVPANGKFDAGTLILSAYAFMRMGD